ncbi:hypothetical protein DPMN_170095 [Dreissena polymorpha]|uniref:Uncharacterized protein n=1 Tax=Dreissena polymorpha TaxID=45954 RepID=A0A9D4DWQ6_DREPO|nr:hypothetical protein DPMN_170095 [Dreissena polymorpha]
MGMNNSRTHMGWSNLKTNILGVISRGHPCGGIPRKHIKRDNPKTHTSGGITRGHTCGGYLEDTDVEG